MIDGVKIDVPNINGSEWLNNDLLDFYTYTNTSTGELLDGTLRATYRGLKFFITKSIKHQNKTYCSVRGSLHKYFNKGKHNANDFTIKDLNMVIAELHQKFGIEPTIAILRNIEFGVNILTKVTANEVLKNLVCYGNYQFGTLRVERITVGKKVSQQRTDFKIYDKSKQYNLQSQNLIRIEVAVKKMVFLKSYNIVTLSDLLNVDKIKPLGNLLLSYWDDVIYYDKKVKWKQFTPFERKKLLYYATPRNWTDFTRVQRYRAKKHFKELMYNYGTSTTYNEIRHLIAKKTENLTAQFCIRINHDFDTKAKTQNVYELTVRIHGYNVDNNNPKKSNIKLVENHCKKRRVCKVCKTNISHKRTDAKYCSKKCNNTFNGIKRTQHKQKQRSIENKKLNRLLKLIPKNGLNLVITYKTETGVYSDELHQSEINTSKNWIRKVVKGIATGYHKKSKPIELNSYRVRKLITLIDKYNIMAYNKMNYYKKIIEIQEITLEKQKIGLNNTEIFKRHIEPKYFISMGTFYNYLAVPAKREIKKLKIKNENNS